MMNRPMRQRRSIPLPLLVVGLLLGGCVNLGGAKPPPFLLTLASDAPATTTERGSADAPVLRLSEFTVPQKLRTPRIPVQQDAGSVAYLVDAAWVEAPQRLFRRLLADRIAADTAMLVIDDGGLATGATLSGHIVDFGVDATSGRAVVTFQALLLSPDGASITQRRFSASEAVDGMTARPVGAALSRAANSVAAEVAGWLAAAP